MCLGILCLCSYFYFLFYFADALVSNDTVKKLTVLFDFLCNFGEWVKLLPDAEIVS